MFVSLQTEGLGTSSCVFSCVLRPCGKIYTRPLKCFMSLQTVTCYVPAHKFVLVLKGNVVTFTLVPTKVFKCNVVTFTLVPTKVFKGNVVTFTLVPTKVHASLD